jgi:hypothetical protein
MTKQELIRLIEGPLAAYLGADCTYSRFIELLNAEFPELGMRYGELYPRLFNLSAETFDEGDDFDGLFAWDIWTVGKDYLQSSGSSSLENGYVAVQERGFPQLVDLHRRPPEKHGNAGQEGGQAYP